MRLGLEAIDGEVARGWRQRDSQPVKLIRRDDLTAQTRAATMGIGFGVREESERVTALVVRAHACHCCCCSECGGLDRCVARTVTVRYIHASCHCPLHTQTALVALPKYAQLGWDSREFPTGRRRLAMYPIKPPNYPRTAQPATPSWESYPTKGFRDVVFEGKRNERARGRERTSL